MNMQQEKHTKAQKSHKAKYDNIEETGNSTI